MKKIIFAIMLLILLVPALIMVFSNGQPLEIGENRTRAERPALSLAYTALADNGEYCESFSSYFNDNFGGRDALIRTKNQIKYSVFGIANGVYVGDEGYLAYQSVVNDQKNCQDMTEEEIAYLGGNIGVTKELLEEKGMSFYFMVCPVKNTVMPEKFESIPAKRSNPTAYASFCAYLDDTFPEISVDVYDTLLEANLTAPVFYKTDFHWDNYGAAAGYSVLVNKIAEEKLFDYSDLNIYTFEFQGTQLNNFAILQDLSETAYGADIKTEHTCVELPVSECSVPNADMYIVNTAEAPLGKLLILGDSFTNYVTKYNPGICECFSEVVFVNMNNYRYNGVIAALSENQFDYVVFETVETALTAGSERLVNLRAG